ncbi:hypothetical protein NQZ67_17645 [Paenibacillus sp. SCIV0701]|uniref:Uncharacterized protein n=1 Tax=Paenibacillus soyae TaxID=2969249 RepID=A0A9X2MT21_9BACL|nr:hypothetical protein [Paenibacillus soyae]MCR2805709.1 hypothetical protein [Paenibacillus soyae]
MAKTKRGKGLWNTPSRGRGTCPICLSTRIKLLYSAANSEGKQLKVCKKCSSADAKIADQAVSTVNLGFRGRLRRELNQRKTNQ